MLNRLRGFLRSLLQRRRLEDEMREEMEAHLARSTERLMSRGMQPDEARRAARVEFGNRDLIEEQARDARGGRWLEQTVADLRFGLRHLSRTPITTATMIVMLALGIGCNTALYAVIYSITTLPPPGVERDESLVRIRGSKPMDGLGRVIGRELPYAEYREYAGQDQLFSAVTAWTSADVVLAPGDQPDELLSGAATYVTADYFRVLGLRPALGRDPMESAGSDDGPPHLAGVISQTVWDRLYGRDPEVLGKTLVVNDVAVTVVGVAPREFVGTRPGGSVMRVWLPLNTRPTIQHGSAPLVARSDSALFGLAARLRPGVQTDAATATVAAIAARAVGQNPLGVALSSADVVPLRSNNYFPPSGLTPSLVSRLPALLIPLMILLIPCTNVSALLVGMAAGRRQEIAVRLSLGAPRRRIVRQLVTEAVLLAVTASVLGLIVIRVLREVFAARFADTPLVLHPSAALVAFGVAILTGVLFGVSPALHATRVSVGDALKGAANTVAPVRSGMQSTLVITQIAVTQPLLLGMAALILTTLGEVQRLPQARFQDRIVQVAFSTARAGERDQQVIVAGPGQSLPRDTASDHESTLARLAARIAQMPGVMMVVPQGRGGFTQVSVHSDDQLDDVEPRGAFWLDTKPAPPGFFELMGYTFSQGRAFAASDVDEGRALIIGSDLALRLWGDANAIGRRFVRVAGEGSAGFVVVGVLDEESGGNPSEEGAAVFVPSSSGTSSLLIRTQSPSEPLLPAIRALANEEAPELPITSATTLAAVDADRRASFRRLVWGSIGVGALALLLSAIGLYAVVTFAVSQRAREIGVRTAFGAEVQQVVRMFFLRGLRLCAIGLAIGLLLSVVVVKVIALAEGQPDEQRTGGLAALVAVVVLAVASLATWIPARRAARVDPITMLRAE